MKKTNINEMSPEEIKKEVQLRRQIAYMKEKYPHRYAWKHYKWSREFFESTNKENFLVAANQIGKSSINIRKCIEWATNKSLWPELWAEGMGKPNQFWYMYPTKEVATIEFKTKWSQFLPDKEKFKNDPEVGYTVEIDRKQIHAIHFHSGVSVYFKTYSMSPQDLQTGTVFAFFGDEEMPVELLPELQARLNASDGYFHLVFTATLGQEHWRRCMEEQGSALETHKGAFKQNVSLYDCQLFEDDTRSHWTDDKIKRAIAKCPTQAEVKRRIFGRFVSASGLKYEAFDPQKNRCGPFKLPKSWILYSGVDIGSGGLGGHPASIAIVAVSPDYTQGRLLKMWRGDGIVTTDADVLVKWRDMTLNLNMTSNKYDWHAKDFFTIATRLGIPFIPAEKNHEIGEGVMNTLFKHNMLQIPTGLPEEEQGEMEKLVGELTSLLRSTPKTKAADDACDALRYCVADIPWDFSAIDREIDYDKELGTALNPPKKRKETQSERVNRERAENAQAWRNGALVGDDPLDEEMAYWNEEYGT